MVWIHGGGFFNGSGDIYDARWLAEEGDIVVVTINYRLGALGFLAHPALGSPGEVGNYRLADQQAALSWVRANIANFDGDPGKVTIAGESAGGMSVCDHLVAPGSAGLFRAGIIQSGPCQAQADLPTAAKISLDYAAQAGCGDPDTAPNACPHCPRTTGGGAAVFPFRRRRGQRTGERDHGTAGPGVDRQQSGRVHGVRRDAAASSRHWTRLTNARSGPGYPPGERCPAATLNQLWRHAGEAAAASVSRAWWVRRASPRW